MFDDAIKSLRASHATGLLICVVWLLSVNSLEQSISQRNRAEQLLSWLLLKQKLSEEPIKKAILAGRDQIERSISYEEIGSEGQFSESPITLVSHWPNFRRTAISLRKIHPDLAAGGNIYSVVVDTAELPIAEYHAIGRNSAVGIVPAQVWKTKEQVSQAFFAKQEPKDWWNIREDLAVHAGSVPKPTALHFENASVLTYFKSVQSGAYNVLGIPLDNGLYFSCVGIILGFLSLAMVGPIRVIAANPSDPTTQAWVLISGTHREPRFNLTKGIAQLCAALFSIAWVGMPLIVAAVQWNQRLKLRPLESWCIYLGTVLLAFSILISAWASIALHKIRKSRPI